MFTGTRHTFLGLLAVRGMRKHGVAKALGVVAMLASIVAAADVAAADVAVVLTI